MINKLPETVELYWTGYSLGLTIGNTKPNVKYFYSGTVNELVASLEAMCDMWKSVCNANGHEPTHMIEYVNARTLIEKIKGNKHE